ncbi:MAG: septum formation inhibitor Maf [Oscillospiraceae bacterium]|nr:septum formation inhibitor Maf [Oscillospiraceae bacterium]
MNVILASASPRRQELLKYITAEFQVVPADVDETVPAEVPSEEAAEFLAARKAVHIAAMYPDSVVIGSDTVVIADGEILGKPVNEADAERMLRKLSGKVHRVVTGVCLACGKRTFSFSQATDVKFYPLTEEEIRDYIATGDPMDKAGAYGIQSEGCVLIEKIDGDFFTVMGLPVARLKRVLKMFIENM